VQARLEQSLTQDRSIRGLELQWGRIVGEPGEVRNDSLQGSEEELKELQFPWEAVGDHQHPTAWPRYADHLSKRTGLLGNEHDAELRPGEIESIVRKREGVTIHHAALRVGQTFLAGASIEAGDHPG
jgi:hypothetical protein